MNGELITFYRDVLALKTLSLRMNSASPRFAAPNPRIIKSGSDDSPFEGAALAAPNHAPNKARLKPHAQGCWVILLFKSPG